MVMDSSVLLVKRDLTKYKAGKWTRVFIDAIVN
jgi:hypothetical protein